MYTHTKSLFTYNFIKSIQNGVEHPTLNRKLKKSISEQLLMFNDKIFLKHYKIKLLDACDALYATAMRWCSQAGTYNLSSYADSIP